MNLQRRSDRRFSASVLLAVLFVAAPAVAALEPDPAVVAPGSEGPSQEGAREGARRRKEAPKSMVLCRGPRGAVYARDVNDGCRNAQLDATNLVAFGAGGDCLLRRATVFDPKGERTATAASCADICKAADEDRECVVGVRREEGAWVTFSAAESFDAGDAALLDATVVCCEP